MGPKQPSLRNSKINFRKRSQIKLMRPNTETIVLLPKLRSRMGTKSFVRTPSSILLWNSPKWRSIKPKQTSPTPYPISSERDQAFILTIPSI